MSFENKVILVTGAASGIGRATALAFAQKKVATLFCLDIHEGGNLETVEIAKALGCNVRALQADLGCVDAISQAFAAIRQEAGRLDGVALVGGYSWRGETLDVTSEQWDKVVGVNLKGVFFCCQEALKIMYPQRSGAIVTMSADGAFFPVEGLAVQAAAKGGVALMTRTLGFEAAPRGVRVNAVSPGIVAVKKSGWVSEPGPQVRRDEGADEPPPSSELAKATAAGRWMEEREIADVFVYLCSDESSGVNGQTLLVNAGGYKTMQYK